MEDGGSGELPPRLPGFSCEPVRSTASLLWRFLKKLDLTKHLPPLAADKPAN